MVDTGLYTRGVTPHENNKLSEPKNIGLYKDNVNVNTFIVTMIKKVTAQELDKVRTKLNNAYKLYDRMTSDVQKVILNFILIRSIKNHFIMIYFILKEIYQC